MEKVAKCLECNLKTLTVGDFSKKLDVIICNPPYFKATSGEVSSNEVKAISRTELKITLEEIIQHAAGVLKYSGKLY